MEDSENHNKQAQGRLKDAAKSLVEQSHGIVAEIVQECFGEIIVDGAASAIPGLSGAYLSYKQKRSYKNLLRMINELQKNCQEIDQRLSELEEDQKEEVKAKLFPALCDFVYEEAEEDKVALYVTGFTKAIANFNAETWNAYMLFSDMLKQLTQKDIEILTDYAHRAVDTSIFGHPKYLKKQQLTQETIGMVNAKLLNLKLIENDETKNLIETVKELAKTVFENQGPPHTNPSSESLDSEDFFITEQGRLLLDFCGIPSNR